MLPFLMQYLAYGRNALLTATAYLVDLWGTVVATLVMLLVQFALWQAVYAGSGEPILGGFSLGQMLTYVLMGRVVAAFAQPEVAQQLALRVRRGTIATDLARPVDLQGAMLAQGLGTSLFRLVAVGLPAFAALWALRLAPLPSAPQSLLFAVALVQGYLLLFGLNFLLGLAVMRTGSLHGLYDIEEVAIRLFSGAYLPVTLFPGWMQAISRALPFESIYYLPLALYSGSLPAEQAGPALLRQTLWCLGLLLLGRLLWSRTVRQTVVQGG